ncbi:MAG TPA: hypothetical protein VN758_11945 [Solirubrobacterales bacterium]|nr:hypothetical protein [Solirubrobacterales bacterium]
MSKPDDRGDPARILAGALGPNGPELSCEECFAQLDRYVELELAGADAEGSVPGMRAHLGGCPACDEDHASLLTFLGTE